MIESVLSHSTPTLRTWNPKAYRELQTQTRGEFGGLGLEKTMENGVVKVVSPIYGSPAAKADCWRTNPTTHLNNEEIARAHVEQAVQKMRGPANTPMTLTDRAQGRWQALRREGCTRTSSASTQ